MQKCSKIIISNITRKNTSFSFIYNKYNKMILGGFCVVILILLALNPQIYMQATLNGLVVFASVLLPSLLPFFVFTKLLTRLNVVNTFCKIFEPVIKFLFSTSTIASYIFFISIISGYPVGAKVLKDCYDANLVTEKEAKKILTFTSNSGPMFIIGTVGVGLLISKQAGYILFFSHIIGSVLNGVFYRFILPASNIKNTKELPINNALNNILNDSMESSIKSLLLIGGYIAVFFTIIELLNFYSVFDFFAYLLSPITNLFRLNSQILKVVLEGLLEVTKGCFGIKNLMLSYSGNILACTGLISFGGICVCIQAMSFLSSIKIKASFYLLQKTTHAIFSMLVCYFLILTF